MYKILFVPLNTNHVYIFQGILPFLHFDYEVLCHDRISEDSRYHTENTLKKLHLNFRHFPQSIDRSPSDSFLLKLITFFQMRREIRNILKSISPDIVVLAIDNDPITQIVIKESRQQGCKTVLVQEALIRPHEYTMRPIYLSDYGYKFLRLCGVYLNYIKYGTGNCDIILTGGSIPFNVLKARGIPENSLAIVGLPKYDAFLKKIEGLPAHRNERKLYVFAACTKVLDDDEHVQFLRKIAEATRKLGLHLIIKLHPRAQCNSLDIYKVINTNKCSSLQVIKEGDETFDILKTSYALITVSSTVVLEALMMNKECIIASYLAGESRLEYNRYNAIFSIEREDDIYDTIRQSSLVKKSYEDKRRLLEDELYKLDGRSGWRAARLIESLIP